MQLIKMHLIKAKFYLQKKGTGTRSFIFASEVDLDLLKIALLYYFAYLASRIYNIQVHI